MLLACLLYPLLTLTNLLLCISVDELHERLQRLEEELQQARQRADPDTATSSLGLPLKLDNAASVSSDVSVTAL